MPYSEAIKNEIAKIDTEIYDDSLEKINSCQLGLEIILKSIKTNQSIFTNYDSIINNISVMEKYLGHLITEYEDIRKEPSLSIKDLMHVKQMLGNASSDNPFKTKFIEPFKNAISEIRKELLNEEIDQ